MAKLIVSPDAAELGLVATYYVVQDLRNQKSDPEFEKFKSSLCGQLLTTYTNEFIERDSTIQGYRNLRRLVGRSPRKFPCSIESLIGFLHRQGTLPNISLAVDCYNAVSLETRLTLGAHDLDKVVGNITLRRVLGDEYFVPLGNVEREDVKAGEYCYMDDSNEILCRLDYKQCDKSKIEISTTRCLFIIQGHAGTSMDALDQGREKLAALLNRFCRTP